MSTNRQHPRLAVFDAVAWPGACIVAMAFARGSGIIGPVLAGMAAVWAAMRVRRALGHGRQPYRLTTHYVLRWSFYCLLFGLVMYGFVFFGMIAV
jgi:hypothetical protein